jgi:hypothetical protein
MADLAAPHPLIPSSAAIALSAGTLYRTECGNGETEWGSAEPNLRVRRPPNGCGYSWLVPDGPVNSL